MIAERTREENAKRESKTGDTRINIAFKGTRECAPVKMPLNQGSVGRKKKKEKGAGGGGGERKRNSA